jgi:hypothetical protein
LDPNQRLENCPWTLNLTLGLELTVLDKPSKKVAHPSMASIRHP